MELGHATITDLAGMGIAFAMLSFVLIAPGFVVGWYTRVLQFRQREPWMQLCLSICFSVATVPIVGFLVLRFGNSVLLCILAAVIGVGLLVLLSRNSLQIGRLLKEPFQNRHRWFFALGVCAWIVFASVWLADWQLGDTLGINEVNNDHIKHVAVISAISRTGVPPENPSCRPGGPLPLRYYYLWHLLGSFVDKLGGTLVDARAVAHAGAVWSGLLILSITLIYLKCLDLAWPWSTRGALVAAALLACTGLDLLPVGANAVVSVMHGNGFALAHDMEHWNEQVSAWVNAFLWAPHHPAALASLLIGFLIIRKAASSSMDHRQPRDDTMAVILAACAFASAAGMSVWVTLVGGTIVVGWLIVCAWAKRWDEVSLWLLAGAVSVLLASQFLFDLAASDQANDWPIELGLRKFYVLDHLLVYFGIESPWQLFSLRIISLPLNYFLEFGAFVCGAFVYWKWRLRQDSRLSLDELFLLVMAIASLVVSTFLRSAIMNNDLGWRGMMFVQFAFLIWCVPVVLSLFSNADRNAIRPKPTAKATVVVCLTLGLLGTGYDLVMLRTGGPRPFSTENLRMRSAYQWIQLATPQDAIVQHNPAVYQHHWHGLYGQRQVIFSDHEHGTVLFGVTPQSAGPTLSLVTRLFHEKDLPLDQALAICRKFVIDYLVVASSDPCWNAPLHWSSQIEPTHENAYVRVYDVRQIRSQIALRH